MTETKAKPDAAPAALPDAARRFVLHWGEMGTRWGVNRTVAQIHALLYITQRPMHAEEIAETLRVARSNVSNSIRELQSWKLVRTVHRLGDRRDHFETHADVWEMFLAVLDERKKREIDPTIALLRECVEEAGRDARAKALEPRLVSMLEFFEQTDRWYTQLRKLPRAALIRFIRLGAKAMPGTKKGGR